MLASGRALAAHRPLEELCAPSTSYSGSNVQYSSHRRSGRRSTQPCRAVGEQFGMWRGEDPRVPLPVGVVPGARTTATTRLTPEMVSVSPYLSQHSRGR